MAFHHVAIATRDLEGTHRFYTEAMGFELVKVVASHTESGTGWSRHVFYDTGNGEMIAFWDLHDPTIPDFDPSISRGLGLPPWTNHLAFDAPTLDDLAAARDRWLAHGHACLEVDHGWCTSIYMLDPNDILVEWCTTTAPMTAADRAEAIALLSAPEPALEGTPPIVLHEPGKEPVRLEQPVT